MPASNLYRLVCLFGALALVGCGGQAAPAVTSAPTEVIAPTDAPTAAPQPTAAATAAPQPTEAPTAALQPTAAATAGPEPTVEAVAPNTPGTMLRGSVTQRPYAVMIDNHPNAYPQSGLDQAAVVFEALAEFGLTRFMAVYIPGASEAARIGPVRSTRLYFAQWALPFSALYVHAGGSPQGLALVESSPAIVNLDALFRANSAYFRRDSQRPAPHNLYTSSSILQPALATQSAQPLRSDIGFLYKQELPAEQRPAAQTLTYFFLYREDSAGWIYDAASNSYSRLRRGRPAVDAESGAQLRAKNVVAMEVVEAPIAGDEKGRIEQQVVGSGRARVFLDGMERDVTWSKPSPEEPLVFLDPSGEEVRFNAGNIWIVALPSLENLEVS
jgi:hypothetical protein